MVVVVKRERERERRGRRIRRAAQDSEGGRWVRKRGVRLKLRSRSRRERGEATTD